MKIGKSQTVTITDDEEWDCVVYVDGEFEWDMSVTDAELRIELQSGDVIVDE